MIPKIVNAAFKATSPRQRPRSGASRGQGYKSWPRCASRSHHWNVVYIFCTVSFSVVTFIQVEAVKVTIYYRPLNYEEFREFRPPPRIDYIIFRNVKLVRTIEITLITKVVSITVLTPIANSEVPFRVLQISEEGKRKVT